jgi:GH24 family phage-related lysozyme (muramidase)
VSNESLFFSQSGIDELKRTEGAIEGLYDDASGYCTSGVGHLVHQAGRWSSFLLAAMRPNANWKTLLGHSGRTTYVPQRVLSVAQFSEIKIAALELAKHAIAKRRQGTPYEKLVGTVAASVDAEATSTIDIEVRVLSQPVDVALRIDILPFERTVRSAITVELRQAEFDSLVSFAFNIGANAFAKSALVKLVNQNKYTTGAPQERVAAIDSIQNEFAKWNKSGGRVLPGLTARRAAEANRFLARARVSLALQGGAR